MAQRMEFIREQEREIPVFKKVDVVTAAALAVKQGTSTRDVDIPTLRKTLINQNVVLDKSLIDLSEITRLLVSTRGIKIVKVE